MSKRPPFVAVRTDIRKEERVLVIADIGGYSRYEAMGRLIDMWAWCADRKLEDAPEDCDGYAVPDAVVRRFLGPRGVEAILGDGCDELALGERRKDGLVYLRGTSETVDRLRSLPSSDRLVTYAIRTVDGGVVKVGRTKHLDRRIAGLQTAHHLTLSLFGFVDGDREEAIHFELDMYGKRIRGEWFWLDDQTVETLAHHGITRST